MNLWITGKDLIKHHCLTKKKKNCSSLNMEDITDVDYRRAK